MRAGEVSEPGLVVAAQAGDREALDELVAACLPSVYTIVRRALGENADADDVVQETMLRALRDLRALRTPESLRPWLATIATRQLSTYLHRRRTELRRTVSLDLVPDLPDAEAESLALTNAELSGHRRQAERASRWLDPDDRALLSLWWLETAGQLTRGQLAAALGRTIAHTGVRIKRMRHQLELSRSLVAALGARPRCAQLTATLQDWDGVPSPLWRKRISRHTRDCPACIRTAGDMVPLERLALGLALLSAPVALSTAMLVNSTLAATVGGADSAAAPPSAIAPGADAAGADLLGHRTPPLRAYPFAAGVRGRRARGRRRGHHSNVDHAATSRSAEQFLGHSS